jgi:hypothetical protein
MTLQPPMPPSVPPPLPPQPNTLGNASLGLGIASAALVFGLGTCALVGVKQNPVAVGALATPLFVCGASSAFLGLLGAIIGVGGLFGANRPKATAVIGLALSILGMCLFFGVLGALRR